MTIPTSGFLPAAIPDVMIFRLGKSTEEGECSFSNYVSLIFGGRCGHSVASMKLVKME
jgi:hypothetical protein